MEHKKYIQGKFCKTKNCGFYVYEDFDDIVALSDEEDKDNFYSNYCKKCENKTKIIYQTYNIAYEFIDELVIHERFDNTVNYGGPYLILAEAKVKYGFSDNTNCALVIVENLKKFDKIPIITLNDNIRQFKKTDINLLNISLKIDYTTFELNNFFKNVSHEKILEYIEYTVNYSFNCYGTYRLCHVDFYPIW